MKKIIAVALFSLLATQAFAQVSVRGYTRQDGTYVQPHQRSAPNNTTLDNYSTRGNVNPYTGAAGTRDPYQMPSYGIQPIRPIEPIRPIQPIRPFGSYGNSSNNDD